MVRQSEEQSFYKIKVLANRQVNMNRGSTMNISISLDSKNHKTVANFWISFLGSKLKSQDEDYSLLELPSGLLLRITDVPEDKLVKNRMHFDIEVDDLEYSRKASISLGGEIVKTNRSGDFEWSVMSDPEGNEFCIHQ